MRRFVPKGCATALLVFGILHIIVAVVIFTCSAVLSSTVTGGSVAAPYWAAVPVSQLHWLEIMQCLKKYNNECLCNVHNVGTTSYER